MKAKVPPFSALLWRKAYYLFVVVVPLLSFTAYLVAILKTDSVHPVNALHCDISFPLWYVLVSSPVLRFTYLNLSSLGLVSWATLVSP